MKTGNADYAVVKHMVNKHPGEQWDFKFALHTSWKTSLERQIMEVIKIAETPHKHLMSSKSEWGSNSVPRVMIQQENDNNNREDNNNRVDRSSFKRVDNKRVAASAKKRKMNSQMNRPNAQEGH